MELQIEGVRTVLPACPPYNTPVVVMHDGTVVEVDDTTAHRIGQMLNDQHDDVLMALAVDPPRPTPYREWPYGDEDELP